MAMDSAQFVSKRGGLGYPGFLPVAEPVLMEPGRLMFEAIKSNDLEVRVIEALPWVLLRYFDLDWEWLIAEAIKHGLQNRLGFITTLARQVASEVEQ